MNRGMSRLLMDGGVETSASYIQTFVLALACYPACQDKAQTEIDRVIGCERIPTLEDLDNLPYLRALIKEVEATTHWNHAWAQQSTGSSLPTCPSWSCTSYGG